MREIVTCDVCDDEHTQVYEAGDGRQADLCDDCAEELKDRYSTDNDRERSA